mgnify:CR=1 FL=1
MINMDWKSILKREDLEEEKLASMLKDKLADKTDTMVNIRSKIEKLIQPYDISITRTINWNESGDSSPRLALIDMRDIILEYDDESKENINIRLEGTNELDEWVVVNAYAGL